MSLISQNLPHPSPEQFFKIQFVSKVTGINPHTIRAWEKRYQAVSPIRDEKGRRLYGQAHIDRLSLLHQMVSFGNNISEIAHLSTEELTELQKNFMQDDHSPRGTSIDEDSLQNSLQGLYFALYNYRLEIVDHELGKLAQELGERDYALRVAAYVIDQVSLLIEKKQFTEEQRDSVYSLLKSHLAKKLAAIKSNSNAQAPVVFLAAPVGQKSEVGMLLVALLCQHYRLNFRYLGGDLSSNVLGELTRQFKPSLIILTGTCNYIKNFQGEYKDYLSSLMENIPEKTKIWFRFPMDMPNQFNQTVHFVKSFEQLDENLTNEVLG